MAIEAMEVDSPIGASTPPVVTELPERKRKQKSQDPASKKKRKHESGDKSSKSKSKDKSKTKGSGKTTATTATTTNVPDSPYSLTTATLYLPLSPISISPTHALASLLAEHLSPLLLTYYPPLKGVVLAYSNASISTTPPDVSSSSTSSNPQPLTLAVSSHEYGVLYVYLTATFLVFRPQKGQILEGWVNVQSEGFLGAVVLNLFSVGIERKRLPADWKWVPPGEEQDNASNSGSTVAKTEDEESDATSEHPSKFDPEKEHFRPVSLASDANPLSETLNGVQGSDAAAAAAAGGGVEEDVTDGYFQSVSGHRVRGTVRFRVLDIDVIPGTDRERGFMSIEASMLSPEDEEKVLEDERNGVLSTATPRKPTPALMSGGVSASQEEPESTPPTTATTPSKKSKKDDKDGSEEKEKKKSKKKSKKET